MAPATVVSSAHCCAGARRRLSRERYYSHGTYPAAGGECVLYADIVFHRPIFSASRLGISSALWARQSLLFYLSARRPSLFNHSSHFSPASTCSRRWSDANSTPCDAFALFFIFREFASVYGDLKTKRRLPEAEDPAVKSDCDTDPRQRRIRKTRRGAHAWHTSPFDLMAIPRM